MDRYTKAFVVASLTYFVAAAAFGIWMGGGSAPEWASFGHVHLNLLGFMAMMIYGVGYFILPRFNARPLVWPGGIAVHFYVANIGLIGMVATYPERPSTGFVLFSLLSLLSAAMFAGNLGATMIIPLKEEKGPSAGMTVVEKASPAPEVTADTRMGEIISRWPQTIGVLVNNGFAPLASPAHQEKVKGLPVTLEMACGNHGVDLEEMIGLLNVAITGGDKPAPAAGPVGPNDIIGDMLKKYPATEEVFRKYYGAACFSCPGQATETIRQSAMMHNADEKLLLRELNEAIQ